MPLIAELERRSVFRVGAAYAIVGWLGVGTTVCSQTPDGLNAPHALG
jgi:hypothetical protein